MLDSLQYIPISNSWQILLDTTPQKSLSDTTINTIVDSIWQKATSQISSLHDSPICCLSKVENKTITCFSVPYRYFYAQKQSRELQVRLALKPVSVSALVCTDDSLIIAKRGSKVTQYKNYWELVPSGPIGKKYFAKKEVDFKGQLLEQLKEEIGLDSDNVATSDLFALIYDAYEFTYDICCQIGLSGVYGDELSLQKTDSEYSELQAIPLAELPAFIEQHHRFIVPTSMEILNNRLL
jgi:hypothetical protein